MTSLKRFSEFFSAYIDCSSLPQTICEGQILSMQIDAKNRMITTEVAFPSLVERRALFALEKTLVAAKKLQLSKAVILPRFPQESFHVEYFPDIVAE